MTMPPDAPSLWRCLVASGNLAARFLSDRNDTIPLAALETASLFGRALKDFAGRSVLLAMKSPLSAALASIELDGVARRIVLCPPDLPPEHQTAIAALAEADTILADDLALRRDAPRPMLDHPPQETEWVLLTSGTTGAPKLVVHDLRSLAGPARARAERVWSTFYDIRRYGGLAIFFRALLGGGSLVLAAAGEDVGTFLERVTACRVTHISGTPSHWRRALMSPAARSFAPLYVRMSGEIADQPILNQLHAFWPQAALVHAFAATEAGFAFEVTDGLAGFPVALLDQPQGEVALKIAEGSLRIRSPHMASRYLGAGSPALVAADGFIDTRDLVERAGDRYHFIGRSDGIINVGGIKIHPEKVEAVINAHPGVAMSLVKARRNPVTGALVSADIVARQPPSEILAQEILAFCRDRLPRHEVPVSLRFVDHLAANPNGKLERGNG